MIYNDGKAGFLTVIIGPMFSEKSGELIKQCLLSQNYQNKTVRIYKPVIDDRYGEDEVVSRIGLRMPAHNISQEITPELIRTILADCETADLVAFDEAQFFSEGLLELTLGLLDRKKQVMIAGLNLDYLGRPFGCIGQLLLHADEVIVKKAYCKCCGRPAMYTQRVIDGQPVTARNLDSKLVLIGDQESYEARCRLCFVKDRGGIPMPGICRIPPEERWERCRELLLLADPDPLIPARL